MRPEDCRHGHGTGCLRHSDGERKNVENGIGAMEGGCCIMLKHGPAA